MPTPSPGKCRGSVVRQLSLQNPAPPRDASGGLKKQFSQDDVGVTGRGWTPATERPVPILRVASGEGKIGQSRVAAARPKPVKVAWADRKSENPAGSGVEVIATKCQGQPRPPSVKPQRLRSPLLGNKDTLVYTRLQLEERLRNAWSERAKMKPNINIFLARGSDTVRSDGDEPPSDGGLRDAASALSDTAAPLDKKRKSMRVRAFFQDYCPPGFEGFPPEEGKPTDRDDASPRSEDAAEDAGRRLQELNKIEIRMTRADREKEVDGTENKDPLEESPPGVKRCRDKGEKEDAPEGKAVTAQDRRANFRRSSALNKTITESFSQPEDAEGKTAPKPTPRKPPLARAFSAPSQGVESPDAHKAADLQKKVKVVTQRRLQPGASFDLPPPPVGEDVAAARDRVKSAPVRRRLKSAAARRKNKDKDSSDEDGERNQTPASSRKTTRRPRTRNPCEIVTMVSLVSPAGSDTEDSVVNLPVDQWPAEERDDVPGGPSGAAADEPKVAVPFVVQKFVSLRKTPKSVTFQAHPALSRGYSASFPSRRAPAGTPVVVPTPVVSNPALTPAQLLERDRRPTLFSGVPAAGGDVRGVKRRLLRSASDSSKGEESRDAEEKPPENPEAGSEGSERSDEGSGKPELRCPKERECWNLYRKMVEKGVAVSFDTVLRGMLTPTEYRLRKNRLLSNC